MTLQNQYEILVTAIARANEALDDVMMFGRDYTDAEKSVIAAKMALADFVVNHCLEPVFHAKACIRCESTVNSDRDERGLCWSCWMPGVGYGYGGVQA